MGDYLFIWFFAELCDAECAPRLSIPANPTVLSELAKKILDALLILVLARIESWLVLVFGIVFKIPNNSKPDSLNGFPPNSLH